VEETWLQQQSRVQLKAENILNLENILNVMEHLQMSIIINANKVLVHVQTSAQASEGNAC